MRVTQPLPDSPRRDEFLLRIVNLRNYSILGFCRNLIHLGDCVLPHIREAPFVSLAFEGGTAQVLPFT